ncbi:MAG: crossover junction endodeoxyribonuclease RuvC [Bacteroidales bacterium]|nr:crossover junction endodeoxyribonuclease RuvC [Bacteroidales bacterium]
MAELRVRAGNPSKDRVILGIDPGTNVMGYGVLHVVNGKAQYVLMGVLKLGKYEDHYLRLRKIFERTLSLINEFLPDEMAIEAPFFGKNVQSMLKLGHAQGCAIAAAVSRDIPIHEYAPLKIKMALTGNGRASKEQVADMVGRILSIPKEDLVPQLDATDALAAAYCHYLQTSRPMPEGKAYKSWKDYVNKNPEKCK